MHKGEILVIDDDDQLRQSFHKLLTEEGYLVQEAASAEEGLALIGTRMPEALVMDLRLPGMNGLEAFARLHQRQPKLPVIIMTAYGTTETAINATKLGAFDYILKPFDIPQMLDTISDAVNAGRFMRKPVVFDTAPENQEQDAIIGSSQVMQDVYKAIGRVAPTDATVLIRGESGTGKELVARAIYQHSRRADKPFLVINCVAIPETLLESELFGYEKGAFTGATHRRIGKIEQAGGGTLFLDEIGDMPLKLQAKLLRLLEERHIERLGGRETIAVDSRIIAATNRHLEEMISSGRFREDLYYRLRVVTIRLPELNRRREDIEALARFHLNRQAAELNIAPPAITSNALAVLKNLAWPGNVRELVNTLQKTLIFNRGTPIDAEDINTAIQGNEAVWSPPDKADEDALQQYIHHRIKANPGGRLLETTLDEVAARLIARVLDQTNGNRSQAAKILGVSRPTLHARIEKYGLAGLMKL